MIKKLISLLLVVLMTGSLLSCSVAPSVDAEPGVFRVGYAKKDIMPDADLDGDGAVDPVPLAGYGNTTYRLADYSLSQEWDTLYATCVALTDAENNTVLLISLDAIRASEFLVEAARSTIRQKTGVPESNIMINASHSHCAPDYGINNDLMRAYVKKMHAQIVAAAEEAMADRSAVTGMSAGDVETEDMNFVRHYVQVDIYGNVSYRGDNFGSRLSKSIRASEDYTTEIDTTMHLLRFAREGKSDVVMANWRAHPQLRGGRTKLHMTADYVGTFRYAMEERGYSFAFYQGSAGNVNCHNNIDLPHKLGTKAQQQEGYFEYGAILADYAEAGLAAAAELETGTIQTKQVQYAGQVNHMYDHLYDIALEVQKYWQDHATDSDVYTKAVEIGKPYGIRSPYMANAIISRSGYHSTVDVELDVVTIGDSFAMTTAPNELFCENTVWLEQQVRELGLYDMTFTLGYTNDSLGYIPSQAAYAYTCYESDTTRFAPGTGELVQETFLQMLKELSAN